jgi:NAD+ synthase
MGAADGHGQGLPARDWEVLAPRIEQFVREAVEGRGTDGVLVAVSGGLDSSTTACLCVRAVGTERVVGLFMPERDGPPEDEVRAGRVAEWLGLRLESVDITAHLEALGACRTVLDRLPGRKARSLAVGAASRAGHAFRRLGLAGPGGVGGGTGAGRRVLAAAAARHRVRMVTAFLWAQERNLLVAGCANRTEKEAGLFVRFGVDHCADIMPIAPLYRTEVLGLAAHLGVPTEVLEARPDPGLLPGAADKYRFFLRADAAQVDLVLAGLAAGAAPAEIAEAHGLSRGVVERVCRAAESSEHMRAPALEPALGREA